MLRSNKMIIAVTIAGSVLGLTAIGCGGGDDSSGSVCDQAYEIVTSAYDDACGDYSGCCFCDCVTQGSSDIGGCDCASFGTYIPDDSQSCDGDYKTESQDCLDDEVDCIDTTAGVAQEACDAEYCNQNSQGCVDAYSNCLSACDPNPDTYSACLDECLAQSCSCLEGFGCDTTGLDC
jgi:hypothetical protein